MKVFTPAGSKFFPFLVVPILKKDAIEKNQGLIQLSPFDVRIFFQASPFVYIDESQVTNIFLSKMTGRMMRLFIWVFTVCQSTRLGVSGLQGANLFTLVYDNKPVVSG